jgi:2-dehydro-3-deoxyphosphogluconate aldolase / (4S)-4-hydroxy-2-oxoglutarate aldolase
MHMTAQDSKDFLTRAKVVAILRGDFTGHFERIAQALADGGVTAMEVTLNSAHALDGIARMKRALGDGFLIGSGTVLSADDARRSVEAGAQFIVAPNTDAGVLTWCVAHDMCAIPGAYTPTEVMNALGMGATLIKLFPAELGYFKAVRAPLSHVPFVTTGGVTLENARDFIKAGAVGVGMGSALIGEYVKQPGGMDELRRRAAALMDSLS